MVLHVLAKGFFPLISRGPTQPPVQWVPGIKCDWGMMLTTHTLVPRL
jgi:hypothetical protein